MHHQTTLNPPLATPLQPGQQPPEQQPADSGMSRNVASFGSDLVQLLDLQTALLKADAREAAKNVLQPAALATIALLLLLGVIPVLLTGLACLLAENGWAWSSAFLTVGGGGVLLVALLGLGAWLLLRSAGGAFTRSSYEWNRNKKWLTESLKQRF